MNNVLYLGRGYTSAVYVKNIIPWQEYGYNFLAEFHSIPGFPKIIEYQPQVLILHFTLTHSYIRTCVNFIRMRKLPISIVVIDDGKSDGSIPMQAPVTAIMDWNTLSKEGILRALVAPELLELTDAYGVDVDASSAFSTKLPSYQYLTADIVTEKFYFLSIVIMGAVLSVWQVEKIGEYIQGLIDNKGIWTYETDNTFSVRIDIDKQGKVLSVWENRLMLSASIYSYIKTITNGETAILSGEITDAEHSAEAYSGMKSLKKYAYYAQGLFPFCNSTIQSYKKTDGFLSPKDLFINFITLLFQGRQGELLELVRDVYLYQIKPSMSDCLREVYRNEFAMLLRICEATLDVSVPNEFKTWSFYSAESELNRLCKHVGRLCENVKADTSAVSKNLMTALIYVAENHSKQMLLEDVAEACQLSASYLSRAFKRKWGIGCNDYLQKIRILSAKVMINNGEKNIQKIALECGFLDAKYFSCLFKKITGQVPSEYISALRK